MSQKSQIIKAGLGFLAILMGAAIAAVFVLTRSQQVAQDLEQLWQIPQAPPLPYQVLGEGLPPPTSAFDTPAAGPTRYTLELGRLDSAKDAIQMVHALEQRKISAYFVAKTAGGITQYLVRTGVYGSKDEAAKEASILAERKIDAQVVVL